MDDIVRKKSLKDALPKTGEATGVRLNRPVPPSGPSIDSVKARKPASIDEMELPHAVPANRYFDEKNYRGVGMFFWTCAAIVFIIIAYFVSSLLSRASIQITTKQETITLNGTYEATKEPTDAPIGFSIISDIHDQETQVVKASGSEKVEQKAKGVVMVYNSFNQASQQLVAGTRLENKDGKIFRLDKTVTVPGMTGTTPGSVEVSITADKAGAEYNIGLADFKVVGFKGTPRYEKFYARAKAPLAGGLVGQQAKVSEEDRARARDTMRQTLADRVIKQAREQIPADYILFGNNIILNYEEEIQTDPAKSDQATLVEKVSLTGILFNNKKLSQYLAKQGIVGFSDADVYIANWDELNYVMTDKANFSPSSSTKISFTLNGQGLVTWSIDTKSWKEKLAGKSKSEYQTILSQSPEISRADATFRPPWVASFPSDPNKIGITIMEGK